MAEPPDALPRLCVFLIGAFLEAPDEHHHAQPLDLLRRRFLARPRLGRGSLVQLIGNYHSVVLHTLTLKRRPTHPAEAGSLVNSALASILAAEASNCMPIQARKQTRERTVYRRSLLL